MAPLLCVPGPVFERYVEEVREQGRHDGKTELTTSGALAVARQYRSRHTPTEAGRPLQGQLGRRDRFDVADAAALPWPDSTVDLVVTSPPYGVGVDYMAGDIPDYAAWLAALKSWLAELYRVALRTSGRLCLNVPLDRDRG